MRVEFLAHLVASQSNLVGIDDDHVVAGVGVRRESRLVLATQQDCSLGGETAKHHVGGVDDVPVVSQISWFRSEGFHWITFSIYCVPGCQLLGAAWSGPHPRGFRPHYPWAP